MGRKVSVMTALLFSVCLVTTASYAADSPSKNNTEIQTVESDGGDYLKDTPWLWSRPPEHWMVQWLASTERTRVEEEAMQLARLQQPMVILSRKVNGRSWYQLLLGDFAERAAAERFLAQVQPQPAAGSYWLRSIGDLHSQLILQKP